MSLLRYLAATLLAVLLVWLLFTWPLPRYAGEGIPSSSQNIELGSVRTMMLGDHLQLMYHFQLVQDFLTGRAPWFHNIYEFNTGDDADRFLPGAYFAPFSLLYAVLRFTLPPAAAWNLVGFLSLWLTLVASLAYVRRFDPGPAAAFCGALLSILIPYRWVNLLGGSPAGFAMMWVPLVALGLDGAVRTGRLRDGWLAAAALFLACWGDLHVFFFTTLSMPLWMGLAALDANLLRTLRGSVIRARLPALFAAASGLLAAAVYRMVRHAHLAGSEMGAGRALSEVRGFSPSARGFWGWSTSGLQSQVYLGFTVALILTGTVWIIVARYATGRNRTSKRAVAALALIAILGVLTLALGVQGPFRGLALRMMRTLVPPYAMVRQTAKIFVILPTILALLGALTADCLQRGFKAKRSLWGVVILVIITGLAIGEYKGQVRTTVCLLDSRQNAYAAVLNDAAARAETPRALVLPIWPGEAAEASVYQFHAQFYGIRIVNGYSPVVSRTYIEEVFQPLQVVNQGNLTDVEINLLTAMGVHYLILHEDLFPEKVSPFPVTLTRDRLMGHARLRLLAQDQSVWAFRIEDEPRDSRTEVRTVPVRFPTRKIHFERMGAPEFRVQDPGCTGGGGLALREGDPKVVATPWRVAPTQDLAWLLRVRGEGDMAVQTLWNHQPLGESVHTVASEDWIWISLPLPELPAFGRIQAVFHVQRGIVEADLGLLVSGRWDPEMLPGDMRSFAAADFFHAGYSQSNSQAVMFRPERDPSHVVFYGPGLPLSPGRYHLEWRIHSDAPAGTELGQINVRIGDLDERGWVSVRAGAPTAIEWDQHGNLPVTWFFRYLRVAPVRIESLALRRLPDAQGSSGAQRP